MIDAFRLGLNGDAHAAGSAGDHAHGSLKAGSIQVRHLDLGNLLDLCFGQLANLIAVRTAGSSFEIEFLFDQNRDRRGLGNEGEGTVRVHSDDNRNNQELLE